MATEKAEVTGSISIEVAQDRLAAWLKCDDSVDQESLTADAILDAIRDAYVVVDDLVVKGVSSSHRIFKWNHRVHDKQADADSKAFHVEVLDCNIVHAPQEHSYSCSVALDSVTCPIDYDVVFHHQQESGQFTESGVKVTVHVASECVGVSVSLNFISSFNSSVRHNSDNPKNRVGFRHLDFWNRN